MAGCSGAGGVGSAEKEEGLMEKKYGGIAPKKSLISKDNGRAFFDSADWVLGKQGNLNSQKSRTAAESLSPKLQQLQRSSGGLLSAASRCSTPKSLKLNPPMDGGVAF